MSLEEDMIFLCYYRLYSGRGTRTQHLEQERISCYKERLQSSFSIRFLSPFQLINAICLVQWLKYNQKQCDIASMTCDMHVSWTEGFDVRWSSRDSKRCKIRLLEESCLFQNSCLAWRIHMTLERKCQSRHDALWRDTASRHFCAINPLSTWARGGPAMLTCRLQASLMLDPCDWFRNEWVRVVVMTKILLPFFRCIDS